MTRPSPLPAVAAGAAAVVLALAAGCGGSSSGPSSPTPTPTPTPVNACGAISGLSASSLAITNGTSCTPGGASVALLYLVGSDGRGVGACSGTVIGSTAVLTAAHCLGADTALVRINFGTKEIVASSFVASPDYTGNNSTSLDVGVVTASQPLGQPIIPLLTSRDSVGGESAVIAGWGQDLYGQSFILRAGATTVGQVGPIYIVNQYTLSGSGTCAGDSGGPMLVSVGGAWAVGGVTSGVSGNCVSGGDYFLNVRNPTVRAFILANAPDAAQK
jgi:hypothetical protein